MKASEEERFRELATASLPWLTRTATALTGDAHRGDDLVQEALVKAYVHWRKVRSADNQPAYLRRIRFAATSTLRVQPAAARRPRATSSPGASAPDAASRRRMTPTASWRIGCPC